MDAVEASAVPGVFGASYRLLDLGRIASDDSKQRNRFHLLARLTWADSVGEAAQLLMDACGWLDLAAEDEQDLFRDYVNWLYAGTGRLRSGLGSARAQEHKGTDGPIVSASDQYRSPARAAPRRRRPARQDRRQGRRHGARAGDAGAPGGAASSARASVAGWARRCARSRIPSNWTGSRDLIVGLRDGRGVAGRPQRHGAARLKARYQNDGSPKNPAMATINVRLLADDVNPLPNRLWSAIAAEVLRSHPVGTSTQGTRSASRR